MGKPVQNRKLLLLLICLLLALSCSRANGPLEAGSLAPDFRADDLTGRTWFLNAELKRPVVIAFFATWCTPCKEEIPFLIDLHKAWGDRVSILSIVVDPENADKVNSMIAGLSIPYPMLMDPGGRIQATYGASELPATFLVGKNGRILSRYKGFGKEQQRNLSDTIQKLAGKP